MYFTYILKSNKNGKYYIGSTSSIASRVLAHNSGSNRSTKSGRPWMLIHIEKYNIKSNAHARELQIKSYKGGQAFKKLIGLI